MTEELHTYQHLVMFQARKGLTTEEILKHSIFTLKERLKNEYSCTTIKEAVKRIDSKQKDIPR